MERPEFEIDKYLERPGSPKAKVFALIKMCALHEDENPIMKEVKDQAMDLAVKLATFSKGFVTNNGISDAELSSFVSDFNKQINTLLRYGKWGWMTEEDHTFHALYLRGQKMDSLSAAMDQLVQLSEDEAMLNIETSKTPEQIDNERTEIDKKLNEWRNILFSWLVSSYSLSEEDYDLLKKLFYSEIIDAYTKQLLVAALMLSAIEFYEVDKVNLLYRLSQTHSDMMVSQRALVGVVIVGLMHQNEPEIAKMISQLGDDKVMRSAFLDIQKVMHLMESVVEDSDKAVGAMMKGVLSSASVDMAEQLNEEGILEQDIEVPLDMEKDFKMSLKKMIDSQNEGVDIYYNQFKNMKKMAFFHSLYNWFMPYYYENSALDPVREHMKSKADLFRVLPYVSNICDNDVYTMALSSIVQDGSPTYSMSSTSIERVDDDDENDSDEDPDEDPEDALFETLEDHKADSDDQEFDDDEDDEDSEGEESKAYSSNIMNDKMMTNALRMKYAELTDPNRQLTDAERYSEEREIRHRFIHDLYRFYFLSPMRNSFVNPFRENEERAFIIQDYFKESKFDKVRLSLARFAARRQDFGFLYEMLMLVENPTTEQTYMKAMACYGTGEYEEALKLIKNLSENGESPIASLHLMLDCYESMGSKKVIEIFHLLEEKEPESKFDLQLRELDFYTSHEFVNEALSLAYTLDTEHPKQEAVECRLAEALMYAKPYKKVNIQRAKDLLAPHISNTKQKLKDMGCFEKSNDPEEMKKKMATLFSVMLNQFAGNVDRDWECRKNRAFGLCTWILEGPQEAEGHLSDSFRGRDKVHELGISVFQLAPNENALLLAHGITQEAIYLMMVQMESPDLDLEEYDGDQQQQE